MKTLPALRSHHAAARKEFAHAPPPFLLFVSPSKPRHSLVALWHLLSLDAPCIAATWTWFIARCCNVQLPWTSPAAMFIAVWMLYAADRLLDARASQAGATHEMEERHRFHARHRQKFIAGLFVSSCLLAALLPAFIHAELRLFAALGALLFTYFCSIHVWVPFTGGGTRRLPKELAVGVFFAAAVFIPTVARAPELKLFLLPIALLFATVCALNCLYIYSWEHPVRASSAHWTTKFALNHLVVLTWCAVPVFAALLLLSTQGAAWRFDTLQVWPLMLLPAACAASLGLFRWLHAMRHQLSRTGLRAAVDLALLTPLLVAPMLRFLRR